MEPFTIHCSSCQSRIRVRNPSMIGQIANCPKCGSMIMIAAPQQILVDSGTGSGTDSVAVTKESLPMPEGGLLASPDLFDQAFRNARLPDLTAPEAVAPQAIAPEAVPFQSLDPSAWLPEPTPPPRADEVRESHPQETVDRSRQLLLVAAVGLCSVLLACGVFFIFLKWVGRPSSAALSNNSSVQPPAAEPSVVAASAAAASANAVSAADTVPAAQSVEPAGASAAEPDSAVAALDPLTTGARSPSPSQIADSSPAQSPTAAPAAPALTPPQAVAAGSQAPPTGAASGQATAENKSLAGGGLLEMQNAANIFPGEGSLASQTPSIDSTFDPPAADAGAEAVKDALPPGLQSFASIFDSALVPVLSDASVPLAAAPDAGDDPAAGTAPAAASSPMTLALPQTLEQKQNFTISGLLIDKRPLSEALATLSLASGIPFTVDLDSLLAAGSDRNATIYYKSAEPVTVAQLLERISQDSGLTFEPYEKQLFIARGDATKIKSRVPASLPIDDLVDSAEQSQALGKALGELLPELAGQFEVAEDTIQTDLTVQNPLLWYQVARVLHTWRALRGISDAEMDALVPEAARLAQWPVTAATEHAQKKISQVVLPEPIAQTWQRLSSEVGMTCWIDWPSIESSQVSPGTVAMVVSHGRTYQDLIQYYANKYQLLFALEDPQTVWVTTPEMASFQPRLYVLPDGGKSLDEWRQELQPLTPSHPADGTAMLRVVSAPGGEFIFVRCCRPILAQPQP